MNPFFKIEPFQSSHEAYNAVFNDIHQVRGQGPGESAGLLDDKLEDRARL